MQIAKIVGNVVMACADLSAERAALYLCQPIDESGAEISDPVIAISPFGGGIGSKVVISTDGASARGYAGDPKSPLRNSIICILDEK